MLAAAGRRTAAGLLKGYCPARGRFNGRPQSGTVGVPTRTLKEKLKLHEADGNPVDKADCATGAKITTPVMRGILKGGNLP